MVNAMTEQELKDITDTNVDYVINNKFLKKTKNGLLLTQEEIDLLESNNIHIDQYGSLDELLRELDEILNVEPDLEELDYLFARLEERKYYEQVNK